MGDLRNKLIKWLETHSLEIEDKKLNINQNHSFLKLISEKILQMKNYQLLKQDEIVKSESPGSKNCITFPSGSKFKDLKSLAKQYDFLYGYATFDGEVSKRHNFERNIKKDCP